MELTVSVFLQMMVAGKNVGIFWEIWISERTDIVHACMIWNHTSYRNCYFANDWYFLFPILPAEIE